MKYRFNPSGVCSMEMIIDIDNDIIVDAKIIGGCPGNTIGVTRLLKGMKVEEAINSLKGIPCGLRGTSCPDQLAIGLEKIKNGEIKGE